MPTYQYECPRCKKITEKVHRIDSIPKKVRCETKGCGRMARRIIPQSGAIQCDSVNDVKWLPSACKVMQRDGERPVTSRTEYNKYLKDNNLVCKG
jgi:putative FmdB family regulatory protein